jgi:L-lactate dehydrogenase complex protein LldE
MNTHVSLFIPCLVDQFLTDIGTDTARLLRKLGVSVSYDPRQTCCGQPMINAGRTDKAQTLARRFIDIFYDASKESAVVAPSGSCVYTVVHHYPELLDGEYHEKAMELAGRVYELSDYLVNVLGVTDVNSGFTGSVAYHHSCHIVRGLDIMAEPIALMDAVAGAQMLPLPDMDVCCGFGGEFSANYPEISGAMVEDKVQKAIATGAEYLVLAEPGCILNIRGYVEKQGLPLKVLHLAQVLATERGAVGKEAAS